MPRLMEKKDWARTVANVGSADRVWCENVVGREGSLSFSIPENGMYQVILVKLNSSAGGVPAKRNSEHDLVGVGRIRIGSMKDEIRLPDNFDEEFEGLDERVGAMFAEVAS